MFKNLIVIGLLGLAACSGMSSTDEMHFGLDAAKTAYTVYCAGHASSSGCSSKNATEAKKSYNIANTGIDDFASGTVTQAQAEALIAKAVKLFAEFQN